VRIAPAMLAAAIAISAMSLVSLPPAPTRAASGSCTDWSSTTEPPPDIRVYRVSEGMVETVDFKTYVIRVASSEWNVKQKALRKAGAQAVKQFAWFHVLHYRGGTFEDQCYDVKDTTADQIYSAKPLDQIPSRVKKAVNSTWSWVLYRDGKLIMTGYRRGKDVDCAENAGYRLYVRSARKCAKQGWYAGRILKIYYTAELVK